MRALRVVPGQPDSASLEQVDEPPPSDGPIVVETVAVGICGTDFEIVDGQYGWAPGGQSSLTIGHEAIGRIATAPAGSRFSPGDLVVPIVRRPDPVPCMYCAAGEWDMCTNGLYTERGIKELDGFAVDRFRAEADSLVPVPAALGDLAVLVEPASVVAKAWEHIELIGHRSRAWRPTTALITGAGPIGLLAALLGVQRGCDVHVFDRVTSGIKPQLVRDLGATYHAGDLPQLDGIVPNVIIECTGVGAVLADVLKRSGSAGIVCLAGVSAGGHKFAVDLGDANRRMVLENDVIFGSVNANRRHYGMAVSALANADAAWLGRLITRRVPVVQWREAFARRPDDVKTVLEF